MHNHSKKDKDKKRKRSESDEDGREAVHDEESDEGRDSKDTIEVHTIDKTSAQVRYEAVMRQRQKDDIAKGAEVTHRDRIKKMNERLSKMTEFNDIPRISAAGNG